jgi:hypothetical protein
VYRVFFVNWANELVVSYSMLLTLRYFWASNSFSEVL